MTTDNQSVIEMQTEISRLKNELVQIQLDNLRKNIDDHERRIRPIEDVAVKFNFIIFLTAGGGLVSTVNLAAFIYLLVSIIKP